MRVILLLVVAAQLSSDKWIGTACSGSRAGIVLLKGAITHEPNNASINSWLARSWLRARCRSLFYSGDVAIDGTATPGSQPWRRTVSTIDSDGFRLDPARFFNPWPGSGYLTDSCNLRHPAAPSHAAVLHKPLTQATVYDNNAERQMGRTAPDCLIRLVGPSRLTDCLIAEDVTQAIDGECA